MSEEIIETQNEEQTEETTLTSEQQEAMNHGWKPFDTYVEEGGDPDLFNGAKAFLKGYKDRQERNQYRSEVSELKGSIDKLTSGFLELQERERTKHIAALEAAKKEAKESLDMDAYDSAQKQIDEIKAQPQPQQQNVPAGEPEFVKAFREQNPVLNHESSEFDTFVNRLVESGVNEKLTLYRAQNFADPPESTFKDWMKKELAQVQNEFGKRKAPTRKAPTVATPDKKSSGKVDAVKLLDDAEKSVYKHLLAANEDAAKSFLKAQTEGR